MRFLHTLEQAGQRGWLLVEWESKEMKDGTRRTCSHVYALRGEEEVFLCSFSELYHMSRARWAALMEERLPVDVDDQPLSA